MPVTDDLTQAEPGVILTHLLAVGHWPGDGPDHAQKRLRFERSSLAELILQEARQAMGAHGATVSGKLDITQILAAADEPRLAELLPGMNRPRLYARNAAFMFGGTLASQTTVEWAKKQIRHSLGGRGFSRATLERCWTDYRSVAPLWLALWLRPNPHRLPWSEAELAERFSACRGPATTGCGLSHWKTPCAAGGGGGVMAFPPTLQLRPGALGDHLARPPMIGPFRCAIHNVPHSLEE